MNRAVRTWGPWVAMAVLLVGALAIGSRPTTHPTVASRVRAIATTLRCPTCRSQSMQESDAVAAQAGRQEIERRVRAGQAPAEIRAYFVETYGKDILLKPQGGGVDGLVWTLPVFALVCAVAGLAYAFRRWRPSGAVHPTPEDRALVDRALES